MPLFSTMTLWYLTTLTYPSTLANRLQVIKMVEAFSRHLDITLWVESMGGKKEKVLADYAVTNDFAIKELPRSWMFSLWPKSFFRALAFRSVIAVAPEETVFYTRDLLLAFFLTLVSPRFRKQFVFESHSLGKVPDAVYREVFRNALAIISTNTAKRDVIVKKYGVNEKRLLVAPNGFDEKLFENLPDKKTARKELGWPEDKHIVLYVGSTQAWKGANVIRELSHLMRDVFFVVLGARERKEDGNYLVLPAVAYRDVPRYLRAADVLLAPYRSDSDRARLYFSPIKVLEYRASGTPVVATDLPSIWEMTQECPPEFASGGGVKEFQEAVEYVFANYEEVTSRAAEAQKQNQKYSWDRRAANIVRFIERELRRG